MVEAQSLDDGVGEVETSCLEYLGLTCDTVCVSYSTEH